MVKVMASVRVRSKALVWVGVTVRETVKARGEHLVHSRAGH